MKKLLFVILLSFSSLFTYAQIEISPVAGYFFGGRTDFYEGSLRIKDNINYGIHMGFGMGKGSGIELSYAMNPSTAQWRPSFSFTTKLPARDFHLVTHIFLLGGIQEKALNKNIKGFGGFKAGAILYHPSELQINDVWRFLIGVNAGIKISLSDRIGIRLQGNMYMPMYFNGGRFYCGMGSGGSNCGASVNSTLVIFEGDLSAGLIFKLGQ